MRVRNPLIGAVAGIAATAGVMFLSGCDRSQGAQQQAPRQAPAVSVAIATASDVPVYLDEIGRTVSPQVVSIVPQIAGKIIAANVEDGVSVKKGQVLFEIDPRPFKASLAAAQASVAQNKADLELAKLQFRRAEELIGNNAVSQLEFDQRKNEVAVADAKVAAAEAAVENAQLDLDYAKIVSPIDGRAGAVWVDAGNVVKANEGTLLMVQQLDPIYAEFTVTENDLGTVRKFLATAGINRGPEPQLGLKCFVDVPGDSQQVLTALGRPQPATQPSTQPIQAGREGSLSFLDNTVDTATGTVKLRATIPNPDHYFWPGQFVNVRCVLTIKKDAVMIPLTAQQLSQQGPFVYVVKQGEIKDPVTGQTHTGMVAEIRQIVPGQTQGDKFVVESGLSKDEQVVVVGQMMVQPGGEVQVMPSAPPAGAVNQAAAPTTQTSPPGGA